MSQVNKSESINEKSPQEITALLYKANATNLEKAINSLEQQEWIDANNHLKKAIKITQQLGFGLNYDAGFIAEQLGMLYNYMLDRLFEANYEKDISKVEIVLKMNNELMVSWNEAMSKNNIALKH